ncbi:MAG: hypothetical protein GDA39_00620 [Hyphomonadaceae bacterium]|nr:hypothetical protein [Hyphomonadaceae bacterium]MBC6411520.1 hypothetical protein [Hyphomonadaceae bacterium]
MRDQTDISTGDDKIHPAARYLMWTANSGVVRNFIRFALGGVTLFFLLQFVFPFTDPKHMAPWDHVPGAWAVIGFVSYCIVVLSAGPLFRWLSRPEDYYGEGGTDG